MNTTRDVYLQKIKAKMDQWNAEIDKLEAKSRELDAQARLQYQQRLEDLRGKQSELHNKVTQAQEAGRTPGKTFERGLSMPKGLCRAPSNRRLAALGRLVIGHV